MANALNMTEIDVAGSMSKGLQNAKAIMDIQNEKKRRNQEGAINNALSKRMPQFTANGKTDYKGMGNALVQDLSSQGQGSYALQLQEALSKLDTAQKEQVKKHYEALRPVMYQTYSTWTDLVKKHNGDKTQAQQEMNSSYWPTLSKAAADMGYPVDGGFDESKMYQALSVDDILKKELMGSREKIAATREEGYNKRTDTRESELTKRTEIKEKNKGKSGGGKTQFVQIADWLKNNITTNDEKTGKPRKLSAVEAQFQAEKIIGKGKFNEQAAAVTLKKAGMSQDGITEFMSFAKGLGADATEQPAAAPNQDAKRTASQQSAFATLRNNPKNKGYSDEQLWQALEQRGVK